MKAAQQGHARAYVWLGNICNDGNGVPVDTTRAYVYYTLAEKLDVDKELQGSASRFKFGLALRMKPEDIQKATQLANDWVVGTQPPLYAPTYAIMKPQSDAAKPTAVSK